LAGKELREVLELGRRQQVVWPLYNVGPSSLLGQASLHHGWNLPYTDGLQKAALSRLPWLPHLSVRSVWFCSGRLCWAFYSGPEV